MNKKYSTMQPGDLKTYTGFSACEKYMEHIGKSIRDFNGVMLCVERPWQHAVALEHLKSGLIELSMSERSQLKNKDIAFSELERKLDILNVLETK